MKKTSLNTFTCIIFTRKFVSTYLMKIYRRMKIKMFLKKSISIQAQIFCWCKMKKKTSLNKWCTCINFRQKSRNQKCSLKKPFQLNLKFSIHCDGSSFMVYSSWSWFNYVSWSWFMVYSSWSWFFYATETLSSGLVSWSSSDTSLSNSNSSFRACVKSRLESTRSCNCS